jgi:uncharacterized protein YkwD
MRRALALLLSLASFPAGAGAAEDRALALINAARMQAGCPALVVDPRLQAAAAGHAKAMAEQDFFDHKGRDGSRFSDRIRAQGYKTRASAENIAAGYPSPDKTVAQWLGSSGHKRNMLNCRYRDTGLAMFYQADDAPIAGNSFALKAYWVQVFAAK